ncbi:hypothetical protein EDC04DRAFT_2718519 [Pisolithus marmoratus]|nr:hypothetical protein EDC04DRAFT_2718519 [Pisolithus marmoratus]
MTSHVKKAWRVARRMSILMALRAIMSGEGAYQYVGCLFIHPRVIFMFLNGWQYDHTIIRVISAIGPCEPVRALLVSVQDP